MGKELIHDKISQQCKQNGDRLAVIEYDRTLTYSELEKLSDSFAEILGKAGIASGMAVVVIADRCLELVAAALAILKCGAVYVPADLNYPVYRIQQMIKDAGSNIVVNLSAHEISGYRTVYNDSVFRVERFDEACQDIKGGGQGVRKPGIAYLIYTSGTTGSPKGVMVSQEAVLNTFTWMSRQFHIDENDVIAFKTSISFTDSIWEIFWPLLNGARLSILNSREARNPCRLYEWMEDQRISVAQFVPALLKVFVEYIETKGIENPLQGLRFVFNGGEQVGIHLIKRFYSCFQYTQYANLYGMTESAIYATYAMVEREALAHLAAVPIGRPILHTKIVLLNERDQSCKPFEKGEICISGVSLAAGYWRDEALTKDRFIDYQGIKDKLYRSGDIGMQDENGCYWYCGRKDNQVQVYGNRIEIYEVEKNILDFSGITQVAVVPAQDHYDETYLICYIEEEAIDLKKLKEFLEERLPKYMIPKVFQKLRELPLTVNHKVDKKKLLQMPKQKHDSTADTIQKIWQLIMGHKDFDRDDEFLQAGGDSLTLTRLQIELEKQGFCLSYEDLLEHQTINQMAAFVQTVQQI